MRIAESGPTTAVIDEFPFLAKASPALPSIIQRAVDPTAQHTNTPARLLLCGLSFMGCCCPATPRCVATPASSSSSPHWTSGLPPSSGRSPTRAPP